jgi:Uma2 family endonuclease
MARVPLTEERVSRQPVILKVTNVGLSQEQFFRLCRDNRELRMELSAQKELIVMTLPGGRTSRRNVIITTELTNWAKKDGTGLTFDSACLFILPNGANRGPDAAWVRKDRWDALTAAEQEEGVPLCPDFVVELISPSDRLTVIRKKMDEYIANGARLGWLIDPYEKQIHVYRPGKPVDILDNPPAVSGDPILPGFTLHLEEIW